MPVKKSPVQKPKKNPDFAPKQNRGSSIPPQRNRNKKTTIKKDIKEAVNKIPEFLFTKIEIPKQPEIKKTEPQVSAPIPPKKTFTNPAIHNYKEYRMRRSLLWGTIIMFSLIIIGLWLWNITTLWQDAKLSNSPEKKLWQEAKNNIDQLKKMNTATTQATTEEQIKQELQKQIEQELSKAKIKNTLEQTVAGLISATSTTSTSYTTTTKN